MRRTLQLLAVLTATTLALCPVACTSVSSERRAESGATLEGTITYAGQPVPAALVIVQGSAGGSTGTADDDGHYKVDRDGNPVYHREVVSRTRVKRLRPSSDSLATLVP